jgi:hypothetical protein
LPVLSSELKNVHGVCGVSRKRERGFETDPMHKKEVIQSLT